MTTQLVRSSMKLMADAGVDIVDMKWFDMTGAFGDKQKANLDPVMTHRPPFGKCFVAWQGKTSHHPSYEVLMLVAGEDPDEGITVSMWKGPSGTRLRPIPAMFYFIEGDQIRYGSVNEDEPVDKELAELMLAQLGAWYSGMDRRMEAYIHRCATRSPTAARCIRASCQLTTGQRSGLSQPSLDQRVRVAHTHHLACMTAVVICGGLQAERMFGLSPAR